jgi:hypothetical protein
MYGRNKIKNIEVFAFLNYKPGQYFFTNKKDKDITAMSVYYKRKVITDRYVSIDCHSHSKIDLLTKVTFL